MDIIIDLIKQGKSAQEIIQITGKSNSTVYRIAKQNGLKFTAQKAWEKDDTLIAEYRKQGKGYREIARLTGKDKHNIKLTCIRLGIEIQDTDSETDKQKRLQHVLTLCSDQGFEYVSGYQNCHSKIKVMCKKCRCVFERCYSSLQNHTAQCPNCLECELQSNELKRKRLKQQEQERIQADKERRKSETVLRRFMRGTAKQQSMKSCIQCGALFSGRGKYCNDLCHRRAEDRRKEHVRRIRAVSRSHDTDITLRQVFEHDNGICYLCGGACDWNDFVMNGDTFIAGNQYPSIDHVIALASGGTHEWENVRLAHRICNSIKSNT